MREGPAESGLGATLFRGSASFLAIYLLGSAISFGIHLAMARVLGAGSYGHFVYAASWLSILLLGCHVGLKPTVVRFVAAYTARRDWGLLQGVLRSSTRWTLGASALTAILALGALWLLRPRLDELGMTLLLFAAAMPLLALTELWSAAVRGFGAVARSQIPASIVQHTLFGIVLSIVVVAHGASGGAADAAGAFLLATVGTLVVAGLLLRSELSGPMRGSASRHARREWIDVAGANLLIALFQAARTPLIVVIAGAHVEPQQLAFYGAAQRLANVNALGLMGLSGFASPMIARYFALGDLARLRRLARLCALGALGAALASALVLAVFGDDLLDLFGAGFASAYVPLLILTAGELVAAGAGPVGFFLTMTGRQGTATWVEAVTSAVAVGLALVLIPRHGILGAAVSVAAGAALRNIAMWVAVHTWMEARSRAA